MQHLTQTSRSSDSRLYAGSKLLLLFGATAIACSCLTVTGCDTGTYNQRLGEIPAAPAEDTTAENADSADQEQTDEDQ